METIQDLKVSLIQYEISWLDKVTNIQNLTKILESSTLDTDLIIFPEMFHTGVSLESETFYETMDGEGIAWLKDIAKKYDAATIASLIIKENNQFYSRAVFIKPSGKIEFYDKRKLFSLAKEEDHFTAGKKSTIISYKDWKILLQICYDLRFPEIQRNRYLNNEFDYDLLVNIANWPDKRIDHWKTLLHARAIENQCYTVGVNCIGKSKYLSYSGDSLLFDSLGNKLVHIPAEEKVVTTTLSYEKLYKIREKLPFLKDQKSPFTF